MTTAALTLPLWLGSCTPGLPPPAGSVPAGATGVGATEAPGAVSLPAPRPQSPPPAAAESETAAVPPVTAQQLTPPVGTGGTTGSAGIVQTASASGAGPGPAAPRPSPAPEPSPSPPSNPPPAPPPAASGRQAGQQTPGRPVTAYYVVLGDAGAKGVRFGCNDSLAGIRRSPGGPAEPLAAAMNALLDGSVEPSPGLYNALSASTLTFLSGTFDGYTVTVYLSGTLHPGGVCDIPRVEAQLTQTAVASVGAIRAEIYVNGVRLADVLSLK